MLRCPLFLKQEVCCIRHAISASTVSKAIFENNKRFWIHIGYLSLLHTTYFKQADFISENVHYTYSKTSAKARSNLRRHQQEDSSLMLGVQSKRLLKQWYSDLSTYRDEALMGLSIFYKHYPMRSSLKCMHWSTFTNTVYEQH